MAFEFASTNLVIELGIIIALLRGWQFTLAEFVGGFLMIAILSVLFRLFLQDGLVEEARRQAERGLLGSMECHATMDISVTDGSVCAASGVQELLIAVPETERSWLELLEEPLIATPYLLRIWVADGDPDRDGT
jgi:hypothetical protein